MVWVTLLLLGPMLNFTSDLYYKGCDVEQEWFLNYITASFIWQSKRGQIPVHYMKASKIKGQ